MLTLNAKNEEKHSVIGVFIVDVRENYCKCSVVEAASSVLHVLTVSKLVGV